MSSYLGRVIALGVLFSLHCHDVFQFESCNCIKRVTIKQFQMVAFMICAYITLIYTQRSYMQQ